MSLQVLSRGKDIYSFEDVIKKREKDREFKTLLDKARLRVTIAGQIKIAREEAGLSQSELADALGISQPMIGRLEGLKDNRLPSIELLAKIASITKKETDSKPTWILSGIGMYVRLGHYESNSVQTCLV